LKQFCTRVRDERGCFCFSIQNRNEMNTSNEINGTALVGLGWPAGKSLGLALKAARALREQDIDLNEILQEAARVLANPSTFVADANWRDTANALLAEMPNAPAVQDGTLRDAPLPYPVWGKEQIDPGAIAQMDNAMRLPVSVAGALMPDAHVGYGLPIGGVLATEGAVIPYAVGVDIACRMRLSVFDASPIVLDQHKGKYEKVLQNNTRFGAGAEWRNPQDDEVMDDSAWDALPMLRNLKNKATKQLGTSGSGNHFAELGELTVVEDDAQLGLTPGKYLALLTHSGSRGVGFQIANHYSKLAKELHPELAKKGGDLSHLGWLDLNSQAGQEYWLSMELAGRFAAANHRVIHKLIAKDAGFKPVAVVENHHNYAWRHRLPDSRDVILHRKGATPAGVGVLGVIPGNMADPGYVVRGKGNVDSLDSASHGAGRVMSRTQALNTLTKKTRDEYLRQKGVTLLGGGLDESPQVYKDINAVMAAQSDLVDIVARFKPRIVIMSDDPRDI
jgi:tRNA-splicing ligase RtcB